MRELGRGILTSFFNLKVVIFQLILFHFSLTIFTKFWDLEGRSPPSPPVVPPLQARQALLFLGRVEYMHFKKFLFL